MITLNLTATNAEQTILLDYLQNNASEVLAEKINNGVRIVKDGKILISKKTLDTFWDYAGKEAQKLAEKGARVKAVDHTTVFGWAIHYFEEDCEIGKLFNEDGTEYKPPKSVTKTTATVKPTVPVPAAPKTMTLFDFMNAKPAEVAETKQEVSEPEESEENDSEIVEACDEPDEANNEPDVPPGLRPLDENRLIDDDGVIYETKPVVTEPVANSKSIPSVLQKLFGDMIISDRAESHGRACTDMTEATEDIPQSGIVR